MRKQQLLFVTLVFLLLPTILFAKKKKDNPNIIIFFVDDMGYGDLGSYGATGWETPNLDALASRGTRFTNFYSAQAVCSASRAGLMTGCYPNRIGVSGALFPHHSIGLNPEETTIAEMLRDEGYATGIFGKWHLGHLKEFLPLQHGFDEYVGLPYSNDMWPVDFDGNPKKSRYPDLPLINGNEPSEYIKSLTDQDKLTKTYTLHAVDFIDRHAKEPFFLYVPHTMAHIPLGTDKAFKGKSEQGPYGDVMMEIDWSMGQIMESLQKNKIAENTLVIFTTDNGPWLNFGDHAGSAGGLREGKTTCWDGGQRVPCIVTWPNHVEAGKVSNQLGCSIDFLPTFAEITGAKLPENKIDGISLFSLFEGKTTTSPRSTILYYLGKNNLNAVRKGNWKLVLPHTWKSYQAKPGTNGHPGKRVAKTVETPQLYNLMRDPGEQYNVADYHPKKVKEIMVEVEKARKELGDLNVGIKVGSENRSIGKVETATK